MSEIWIQVIAGLSGIASTLAVKYLEYILSARRKPLEEPPPPPPPPQSAVARPEEA